MDSEAVLRLQLAEMEVRQANAVYKTAVAQSRAARTALKAARRHLVGVRTWAAGFAALDAIPAKERRDASGGK